MSRVGLSLMLTLSGLGLGGCLSFSAMSRAIPFPRNKSADTSPEPGVVYMDIAPLSVPLGDRRVNDELWTSIDEQVIPTRQRLVLSQNGFRVGLAVGGRAPDELHQLLTQKKTNPQPYQSRRQSGNPSHVTLAKDLPNCEFELRLENRTERRQYRRAIGQISIVPTIEKDGTVRLQCVPQFEFDDPEKWSRINPRLALPVQGQRSTERFEALQFEMTLSDNDFLVIGGRFDSPDSLAARLFFSPDPDWPVQKLLAVRAGTFATKGTKAKAEQNTPPASLAAQAAMP